jgi:hypothetical protein
MKMAMKMKMTIMAVVGTGTQMAPIGVLLPVVVGWF